MADRIQVALITGGNRGIGLQTALDLGKLGFTVIISARDADKATPAVAELRAAGIDADAVLWDAADPGSDAGVVDFLTQRFGRLDVLVNNAGALHEDLNGNTSTTISQAVLQDTFQTNFFAVVRLTQALLPLVRAAPAGRIVNLSSILGSLAIHAQPGSPLAGAKAFAYNASKTALNAFTVHLAAALADTQVKVNSAHPGWVKTELGGPHAPLPLSEGSKTSVALATLGADGPSGAFLFNGDALPW